MTKISIEVALGWLAAATAAGPATVPAKDIPALKTGDIVFQTTTGPQSTAIMMASGSRYTHVGIVELDSGGKPMVVEAVGPVRTISFDKWVAKGVGKTITIKRFKDLDEQLAKKAVARAHFYDGRPYDIYFHDSRNAIYCSELVHAAFKEGAAISVGKVERLAELNVHNAAAQEVIKARWKGHPTCRAKKAGSFSACYSLILEETLVTPASIARDPQLETIFTSFGSGAE